VSRPSPRPKRPSPGRNRPSPGPSRPPSRLPPGPTCRVDFSRPLEFTFLDREMTGYAGDTVASALYGAGVRIFGRSLK